MARSQQDLTDPTRSAKLMDNYTVALQNIIKALEQVTVEYLDKHPVKALEAIPTVSPAMMPAIPKGGILDLAALRDFFTKAAQQAINGQSDYIGSSLEMSYSQGVKYAGLHLKKIGITTSLGMTGPDKRVIDALVTRNLSGIKGITEATGNSIITSLSDGMLNGEGIPKLRTRVLQQCDAIGYRRAEMLARTETVRAVAQGTLNRYTDAGVKYVKWLAANQPGRTCTACLDENGTVYSIEESYGMIPKHPNCRCCWTPIVEA